MDEPNSCPSLNQPVSTLKYAGCRSTPYTGVTGYQTPAAPIPLVKIKDNALPIRTKEMRSWINEAQSIPMKAWNDDLIEAWSSLVLTITSDIASPSDFRENVCEAYCTCRYSDYSPKFHLARHVTSRHMTTRTTCRACRAVLTDHRDTSLHVSSSR